MSLLEGLQPTKPKKSCKVRETVLGLDIVDQAILDDALEDNQWTHNSLSRALRTRGIVLGKDTIRNHREKSCPCFKD